jgi:hypothetical protein
MLAKAKVEAKAVARAKVEEHHHHQHQALLAKFVPNQIMMLPFVGIGMILILTYQVKVVVSMQDLEYKRA